MAKDSEQPKKNNQQPAGKKFNFSVWYLLAILLALFAAQVFLGTEHITSIPYSKFKEYIEQGRLKSVAITPEKIYGDAIMDSAGTSISRKFETTRVEDPELVKQMQEKKIEFEGKLDTNWWKSFLFAWILPFGIIFVIWSFLIRRMGGGGGAGGVMSFGKSRAKVYMESATKITFKDVAGIDEAVATHLKITYPSGCQRSRQSK